MSINYYQQKNIPTNTTATKSEYYLDENSPLIAALNIAIHLGMPLLLTGEPGTGKTKFAKHIAERFELGNPLIFNAKTTSNASDLFYYHDALRHFHLASLAKLKALNLNEKLENKSDEKSVQGIAGSLHDLKKLKMDDVIRLEALGKAIEEAQINGKRSVVLIDEIDKAPRDFPNDLLNQLEGDEFGFKIPEWGNKEYKADASLKPIVIITSNSEKNLPEPFLRRCVYHHIEFPNNEDTLIKIIGSQLSSNFFGEQQLKNLIQEFLAIRKFAEDVGVKKPATAELINWLAVLQEQKFDISQLHKKNDVLISSYSVLAKDKILKDRLLDRLDKEI